MDQNLKTQLAAYLSQLDGLIRRGLQLRDRLAVDSNGSAMTAARAWQDDCGVTINQLSGGSKSHWLARAFSEAFLMRSDSGSAVEGVAPVEIVKRLLDVLERAVASLSGSDDAAIISTSTTSPAPHRFDFLHNPELRPVVEQAYLDSRRALDEGDYQTALLTTCGILEAIVTDALERKGLAALATAGGPAGAISDWPFETRLAVAERAGLIRGGCARLPAVARGYRDHDETAVQSAISERDARQSGQVLRVVMRDLDPGR